MSLTARGRRSPVMFVHFNDDGHFSPFLCLLKLLPCSYVSRQRTAGKFSGFESAWSKSKESVNRNKAITWRIIVFCLVSTLWFVTYADIDTDSIYRVDMRQSMNNARIFTESLKLEKVWDKIYIFRLRILHPSLWIQDSRLRI